MNRLIKAILLVVMLLAGGLVQEGLAGTGGLSFNGTNQYVTCGAAPSLGVTNFTIECWFKRTGVGKAAYTGTGGTYGVPLVTRGRSEAESPLNKNCNFFFGISTNTGGLTADFEDKFNGGNHPITSTNSVDSNVWQHAAVTYSIAPSGTNGTWRLYLNGALDATGTLTNANAAVLTPENISIQHAALGSALDSTGSPTAQTPAGYFAGSLDEVRIWNKERTDVEIAAGYNQIITNATGLIARWGLDATSGTNVANSVSGGVAGFYVNGGANAPWTNGYFQPPSVAITNPANNATISATNVTIEVDATDAEGSVTNVEFLAGSTSLGSVANSPFSFNWSGVAPGTYALRAVATDNLGLVATSAVVNVTVTPPPGAGGIYFDGVNDYVTFGAAPGLGVTNFTIECWFKQQGAGKKADTGTGGFQALPLVTRGMAESEAGNTNMNYFFGLGTNNAGQPVLAADFEDFAGGTNRPVRGSGLVASNTWQHGAVTYDVASGTWKLYLNGALDTTLTLPYTDNALVPRFDSIQHAALGGSLRTGGTTNALSGFFAGSLDEVRIWNTVRSSNEIAANYQAQITNAPGLIARWALDDAAGLAVTNSGLSGVTGALTNGPVWVDGYPFPTGPMIVAGPVSTNVSCGGTALFEVNAAGAGSLAYQWYFGPAALTGETNSTLVLASVNGANAGSYLVTVQNMGGSITSAPAVLTVSDTTAPNITVCATNMSLSADTNCQVAIPDLTVQVAATDACSAVTLTQSPLSGTIVGLGNHLVTITATDAATNFVSCSATIAVVDTTAPNISVCATNMTLSTDTNCQAVIPDLTVQVTATDACSAVTLTQSPLAGTIVGLGNHLVTITATDAATNFATCSATVAVTETNLPVITLQPLSLTNLVGSTAVFTLTATACGPLTYQWMLDTNALVAATNATLTLTNVQLADAGSYLAVVANGAGSSTSTVATLTVLLPVAPVLSSGPVVTNGVFAVGFTGSPNVPYTILTTTNLTGTWDTLTNLTADGAGFIPVADNAPSATPQRYYRLVFP